MKTVRFSLTNGAISIRAVSGYMQPAVFSLFLWARGDAEPTELGGGVLLKGEPTVLTPPLSARDYTDRIIQAVVTVSLVSGRRYAPDVRIEQQGVEIGADSVDKSTNRKSIGIQFLFLMEAE